MILLDSDHISVLQVPDNDRRTRLLQRMSAAGEERIGTTIITVEEQMRGWLASVAKERTFARQEYSYRKLRGLFDFYGGWEIIDVDGAAVFAFEELQRQKIRIGTMDLKIAAIDIACDALLLTANRRDFEQVPALRFENWLDA